MKEGKLYSLSRERVEDRIKEALGNLYPHHYTYEMDSNNTFLLFRVRAGNVSYIPINSLLEAGFILSSIRIIVENDIPKPVVEFGTGGCNMIFKQNNKEIIITFEESDTAQQINTIY